MDDLDRRLISELRLNSRLSVPSLATLIGVARGTAQARLDKLIASGTIRSFTINLRDNEEVDELRAIMLIELTGKRIRAPIDTIKRIPGFIRVSNTTGIWDLIAEVGVPDMKEMNRVISQVRALDGVAKSETSLILGPA